MYTRSAMALASETRFMIANPTVVRGTSPAPTSSLSGFDSVPCDSLYADSGITVTCAPVSTHQVNSWSFISCLMCHPESDVFGSNWFCKGRLTNFFDVGVVVTLPKNVGEESPSLSRTWLTM